MVHKPGPALERLDAFAEHFLGTTGAPGVSIAVTDRQRTVHLCARGFAEITAKIPVEHETLFQIGSISKSFASICVMQLVEEGKVDLDEPVKEYVPWLAVRSKHAPFTLHNLMTHTAGIVLGSESTFSGPPGVLALRETETGAPPGEFFHYSNVGYKIVGLVLEQVLRKPIGAILRERLLDRLGMDSTEATITNEIRDRLAVGYVPYFDDRPSPLAGPLSQATWLESDTADGSISTTAGDMAKYVRMLLNKGKCPDGRVISEESFSMMTKKHVPQGDDYPGVFYGYGLGVENLDGHVRIGHTGGMVGFVSSMRMDMDDGIGLIVMLNSLHDADVVAKFGIGVLSAAVRGNEIPTVPSKDKHLEIENASDYVGKYAHGVRGFNILADGRKLIMQCEGRSIALEPRDKGMFCVDHPDFRLFLLGFEKRNGSVVAAFHGSDVFVKTGTPKPKAFKYSREWESFTGHFRSYNPWLSNFRVVLRSGSLLFIVAQSGAEEPMRHLAIGKFRIGKDDRSPETIEFDQIVDGKAQRAILSCGDCYYRVPTP